MKNRPRPHIPLSVRVEVARRQVVAAGKMDGFSCHFAVCILPAAKALHSFLGKLFGDEPFQLDHDPPLRARLYNPRIKDIAARYTPNANDPAHLIYRTAAEHRVKTNLRGDGAQFPDRVLIKRERRREKRHVKKDRVKIANRKQWPTGRTLRSRPWTPKP